MSVHLLSPSFAIRMSYPNLFLTQCRSPRVPWRRELSAGAGRTAGLWQWSLTEEEGSGSRSLTPRASHTCRAVQEPRGAGPDAGMGQGDVLSRPHLPGLPMRTPARMARQL